MGPRSFLLQMQEREGLGQEVSVGTHQLFETAVNNQGKSPGAPAPFSLPLRSVEAAAAVVDCFIPLRAPSRPLPLGAAGSAVPDPTSPSPCPSSAQHPHSTRTQTTPGSSATAALLPWGTSCLLCPGLQGQADPPKASAVLNKNRKPHSRLETTPHLQC